MNNTRYRSTTSLSHLDQQPRKAELSSGTKIVLLLLAHIPLAFLLRSVQLFATLHALFTMLIGVWIAITSDDIKKVVPIVAYITGAEVLWRMTDANVFWEFGKYATVAILVIALLKRRKFEKASLPILYFFLLLPSIILTVNAFGFSTATRNAISFNLSGPLAVMMCMLFFRLIKTSVSEIGSLMWWAVYPILSMLTLASYSTLTTTTIRFGTVSVLAASGGFGPNQVSGILGLGAMLLIMLAIHEENRNTRNLALILSIALLVQSVLTFSRGGIANVFVALPLAFVHLLGSPKKFIKGLFVVLLITTLAYFFLIPQLQNFTGGSLEARFTDLRMSGREDIARADIELWLNNPILGVGPGISTRQRIFLQGQAAHTEYTRILAEHGFLGLLSLLCLGSLLFGAYLKAPDAYSRAWIVALAAWPVAHMAHSAMRVVSISFLLGLALVSWEETEHDDAFSH